MIFITYLTKDSEYYSFLQPLETSIKKLGFDFYYKEIAPQKFWEYNAAYKAEFCLESLVKFKTKIVWIDVDAILLKSPDLLTENNFDLAFCRYPVSTNFYSFGKYPWNDFLEKEKWQYRTGVIGFNHNENVINFLKRWHEKQSNAKNVWDQIVFQKTLKEFELQTLFLPLTYTVIRPYSPGIVPKNQVVYFREDIPHPKNKLRIYHHEIKNIKFI